MKTLDAIRETIEIAVAKLSSTEIGPASAYHMVQMLGRIDGTFSEGKINRWLGYMQGVLVARNAATLDEVKEINKRHA